MDDFTGRETGLFKPVWMPDCCSDGLEYVEDEKNGDF